MSSDASTSLPLFCPVQQVVEWLANTEIICPCGELPPKIIKHPDIVIGQPGETIVATKEQPVATIILSDYLLRRMIQQVATVVPGHSDQRRLFVPSEGPIGIDRTLAAQAHTVKREIYAALNLATLRASDTRHAAVDDFERIQVDETTDHAESIDTTIDPRASQ